MPGKQFVQLTLPKVAEPRGHWTQVAEPATETAPFGQVSQAVLKIEKSFGFAVLTGHWRQVGLLVEPQSEFKYDPGPQLLLHARQAEPSVKDLYVPLGQATHTGFTVETHSWFN